MTNGSNKNQEYVDPFGGPHVVVGPAYENYYSNIGSKLSGSMSVVDMSLYKTCRAPFLAIGHRFEKWYLSNKDNADVKKRFNDLVHVNRVESSEEFRLSPRVEMLQNARKKNRRILCYFGKILCDSAVPYDGGPAHSDIIDWLGHSIEVARENPDLIMLIKSNPHEHRPEIALELTEKLEDILPKESLPWNVILLEHNEFNAIDLIRYIDFAVLWNGTASLELTGLGMPVLICSHFGRHDYPISLNYPDDRLDYATKLSRYKFVKPDRELREKAIALLHYMGMRDVAIPNTYSRRPITNDQIGCPRWDMQRIDNYLTQGDPFMALAAQRITEGITQSDA